MPGKKVGSATVEIDILYNPDARRAPYQIRIHGQALACQGKALQGYLRSLLPEEAPAPQPPDEPEPPDKPEPPDEAEPPPPEPKNKGGLLHTLFGDD